MKDPFLLTGFISNLSASSRFMFPKYHLIVTEKNMFLIYTFGNVYLYALDEIDKTYLHRKSFNVEDAQI